MVVGIVMTTERDLLLFLAERLPNKMQWVLTRFGLTRKKTE